MYMYQYRKENVFELTNSCLKSGWLTYNVMYMHMNTKENSATNRGLARTGPKESVHLESGHFKRTTPEPRGQPQTCAFHEDNPQNYVGWLSPIRLPLATSLTTLIDLDSGISSGQIQVLTPNHKQYSVQTRLLSMASHMQQCHMNDTGNRSVVEQAALKLLGQHDADLLEWKTLGNAGCGRIAPHRATWQIRTSH